MGWNCFERLVGVLIGDPSNAYALGTIAIPTSFLEELLVRLGRWQRVSTYAPRAFD